jgi:hypothetical protein
MSTLCFFLLLGGGAYAAGHLGKNTVGTKQLKKNSVTTKKIKKQAVTAAKVKPGTLTGAQINASTLGAVPNAVNSQSLGGLSADQIEQSSKRQCPAGTAPASGDCFETASRPAAEYKTALETCASANRSLPSVGELATYLLTQEAGNATGRAGPNYYIKEVGFWAPFVSGGIGGMSFGGMPIASSNEFRCVTGPTN